MEAALGILVVCGRHKVLAVTNPFVEAQMTTEIGQTVTFVEKTPEGTNLFLSFCI